jgi:hypothetical protein
MGLHVLTHACMQVVAYDEILRDLGPLPVNQDEVTPKEHRTMRDHVKENHVGKTWYFNSVATTVKKADYAYEQGLGGVYIWEAGQDASIRCDSFPW